MNRQTQIFLCYLGLIAVATSEVLMKLPVWIGQGCPPLLIFWVFKGPFLVGFIVWFTQRSTPKSEVVVDE